MTWNRYGKDWYKDWSWSDWWRSASELKALDKFEKFCRYRASEKYQKNLANWYIKNYGVSKDELKKLGYRSKRHSHWSGDEDYLWFNPNEFYGF